MFLAADDREGASCGPRRAIQSMLFRLLASRQRASVGDALPPGLERVRAGNRVAHLGISRRCCGKGPQWALCCSLSVGAVLLGAATSTAAPLVYSPSSCGSAATFESELRKRLDEATRAGLPPTELSITRVEQSYLLRLRVGADEREIIDASCEDLFHAAVVVVASLAETRESSASPSSASAGTPGQSSTPAPSASPSPPRQALPRVPASPLPPRVPPANADAAYSAIAPRWGAELAVGASVGVLPEPALALKGEVSATWNDFGVAASIRFLPSVTSRDEAQRGVRADAWGAHVGAQVQPLDALLLQAGAAGYRLSGVGVGSLVRSSDAVWGFGPVIGAKLLPLRLKSSWVSLGLEGQLELLRPRFEILGYGEVFRAPQFLLSGSVGLGHRF